jgi:hypothetical protein
LRRIVFANPRCQRRGVGRRLFDAHAIAHSADDAVVVKHAAGLPLELIEHERQPELCRFTVNLWASLGKLK